MNALKSMMLLIILSNFFLLNCKDKTTNPIIDDDKDTVVVYKPNLYLYPVKKTSISIKLLFPLGGELLEAIPKYDDGWNVTIDTNGVIENDYTYLFYEYRVPDYHQKQKGWLIANSNLYEFFSNNMRLVGFTENEIKDFTDYWVPKLNKYPYYEIYPQYRSTLDQMTEIIFSVEPDNFYRMQYLIKGRQNNNLELEEPVVKYAKREGFYVVEWGVVLK